jgi:hypothetical protein
MLRKLDGGYLKERRYVRDTASSGKGKLKELIREFEAINNENKIVLFEHNWQYKT